MAQALISTEDGRIIEAADEFPAGVQDRRPWATLIDCPSKTARELSDEIAALSRPRLTPTNTSKYQATDGPGWDLADGDSNEGGR